MSEENAPEEKVEKRKPAIDATGNTVNTATELVTLTAHGLLTGEAVIFATTSGGVTANIVYYINRDGANTFSIHLTFADAIADTSRVNLTGDLADDDIFRVGGTFAQGAGATASEVASFAQGDKAIWPITVVMLIVIGLQLVALAYIISMPDSPPSHKIEAGTMEYQDHEYVIWSLDARPFHVLHSPDCEKCLKEGPVIVDVEKDK